MDALIKALNRKLMENNLLALPIKFIVLEYSHIQIKNHTNTLLTVVQMKRVLQGDPLCIYTGLHGRRCHSLCRSTKCFEKPGHMDE
jgi:hypothetical protein